MLNFISTVHPISYTISPLIVGSCATCSMHLHQNHDNNDDQTQKKKTYKFSFDLTLKIVFNKKNAISKPITIYICRD